MSTSWRKGMDTTTPFVAPYQEREKPRTVRSELSDSELLGAWIRLDLTKLLIPFCTKVLVATSFAASLAPQPGRTAFHAASVSPFLMHNLSEKLQYSWIVPHCLEEFRL